MYSEQKKYKICLVSECLSTGGAERVAAVLSNFFEKKNIEVNHVIFIDSVAYPFSGELLNLGKIKSKINKFFVFKNYLKSNQFDCVIDFRTKHNFFQELLISRLIYRCKDTIYSIHSFKVELYFSKFQFLNQLIFTGYKLHTVSNSIAEKLKEKMRFNEIFILENPIDISTIKNIMDEQIEIDFDYIICSGRMNDSVKQIDKLILSYKNSILPQKGIKLVVLGDGALKEEYRELTETLNIKDKVLFLGQIDNPYKYFKNARYFVLTSLYEGFPMVLLESLACGTPVISFDCKSGPSEIIENGINGLLVQDQNFENLTEAMDYLIENELVYNCCKSNALKSVDKFSIERIGNIWLEIFKKHTNEYRNN